MTAMHVTVHTRDDGVSATVQERDQATWLELKSGGQTVTIFVKSIWQLVDLADRIDASQEDEISFMEGWLKDRGENVPEENEHSMMDHHGNHQITTTTTMEHNIIATKETNTKNNKSNKENKNVNM